MCCCMIDTDVLLANLFSRYGGRREVPFGVIQLYLDYLQAQFPTYVTSDLSVRHVLDCAGAYPELYQVSGSGENLVVRMCSMRPKLDYFHARYPAHIADYMTRLTASFV